MDDDEDRTWLLGLGDIIVSKMADTGFAELPAVERLVYCLWVADYGIVNAGDLETCQDLFESFLGDGLVAALELDVPASISAFSLSPSEFERNYFSFFGTLIQEIRALPSTPRIAAKDTL
jgi:hypothetical protein